MTQNQPFRQEAMPEDMRLLLRDYPRDIWPDHPNFAASIQNWMGAHVGFRQIAAHLNSETEAYLDKDQSAQTYAATLSRYGNLLVRNLHGHHSWEDHSFFPELSSADQRFDPGLALLESDHDALDGLLDRITRTGNRVVQLIQLDEAQARDEAGALGDLFSDAEGFLARHLTDEEDLVVPIILHHQLRG